MFLCVLRTNSNARIAVDSLHQLFALMPHHPVGVNLRGAFGIQGYHLESAEVCFTDGKVLRANIMDVQDIVLVKIILANISTAITFKENLNKEIRKQKMRTKILRSLQIRGNVTVF